MKHPAKDYRFDETGFHGMSFEAPGLRGSLRHRRPGGWVSAGLPDRILLGVWDHSRLPLLRG